ncbi:hypothetical protein D3C80_1158860 [compost metagenome]
MAHAGLEGRLHHPDAVPLPAHQVRIDELRTEHLLRILGVGEAVGVVRNVHLLLAYQLPVEAVHPAVEQVDVVDGRHTRGAGIRRVVGQVGCQAHTALSRQILKRLAPPLGGGVVEGHHRFTGTACRAAVVGPGTGKQNVVATFRRIVVRHLVGPATQGGSD